MQKYYLCRNTVNVSFVEIIAVANNITCAFVGIIRVNYIEKVL